jgi:hypothetical protein
LTSHETLREIRLSSAWNPHIPIAAFPGKPLSSPCHPDRSSAGAEWRDLQSSPQRPIFGRWMFVPARQISNGHLGKPHLLIRSKRLVGSDEGRTAKAEVWWTGGALTFTKARKKRTDANPLSLQEDAVQGIQSGHKFNMYMPVFSVLSSPLPLRSHIASHVLPLHPAHVAGLGLCRRCLRAF